MSDFLGKQGIEILEGYDPRQLVPSPDIVLIGNALSRGNECVEAVLNRHLAYQSGPQWLSEHVLQGRHVIAISGTHGKTTTTSIASWILDRCGLEPGYLIGGIAQNFDRPANLGGGRYFVIEADEYDSAFFDKRSKFVHYRPDTLVINNLEYDHADIFPDLESIKRQFHHLVRTVPSDGTVILPGRDNDIEDVLKRGCWSETVRFGFDAPVDVEVIDYTQQHSTQFALRDKSSGETVSVNCELLGRHNALNATAAICAATAIGVPLEQAGAALESFRGVKRRLEIIGKTNGITVYDDFAHHPSAIEATLSALRVTVGRDRIICLVEPRSNTMRLGVHNERTARALDTADCIFIYHDLNLNWDSASLIDKLKPPGECLHGIDDIIQRVMTECRTGDHIVIMSNGSFANIHTRLLSALGRGSNN
jgi:UDP-N-acetylmuramate: L-alanyl-gamma-D-glutamyl-meso-diaminopimelate ligase